MKPRALYYDILQYCADNVAYLHQVFDTSTLPDPRADTPAELQDIDVLFAPLGFPVDRSKIEAAPNLKVIASNTTGIPHIDVEAVHEHNIVIAALHDDPAFLETITATAEHTIGLMLALWRKIPWAHQAASAGTWSRWSWGAPKMLSRMRLGIVGYGRLGRKVARIAEAMDMTVRWHDPYQDNSMSLEAVLEQADVLCLHATATPETFHLVNRAMLERLPQGAIIINTARGELLDLEAVLDKLDSGHLAGVALDTIDGEYDPSFASTFAQSRVAQYARTHDNLLLTPHIGGSTYDAWHSTQRRVIDKAIDALHRGAT